MKRNHRVPSSVTQVNSSGIKGKEKTKAIQQAIYNHLSSKRSKGKSRPEIGFKYKQRANDKKIREEI